MRTDRAKNKGCNCELHDIVDCEWCALGVKYRSVYGRRWPYAMHPVTHEYYCLEPVESSAGDNFPCCSFRRERPIKTSQGYAGHLVSHRSHTQGSIDGIGGTPLLTAGNSNPDKNSVPSVPSRGNLAPGNKRKRSSTLMGSHEAVTISTLSTETSTTSSSDRVGSGGNGGKVMPQFAVSLQPSLPRCDLDDGRLRFVLLAQDSEAAAVDVIFKGHRGKLCQRATKNADGFFEIACPLVRELLLPNDTRIAFEVSVRVEEPATCRRLFQSSLLFTQPRDADKSADLAANQTSVAPRAKDAEASASAPWPPAWASADKEEEGEEKTKEETATDGVTDRRKEDGSNGKPAEEEKETKNKVKRTNKKKRRKIEAKNGEMKRKEISECMVTELYIDDEDKDDEGNDPKTIVNENEGDADDKNQNKQRQSQEATPRKQKKDARDKNVATCQHADLQPDTTAEIEEMSSATTAETIGSHEQPRESSHLLARLAEVALAEPHGTGMSSARSAYNSGEANTHFVEKTTTAEALYAMPMDTVLSPLPWNQAADVTAHHPSRPHVAPPGCFAPMPTTITINSHAASLMMHSYRESSTPFSLSSLLPPTPHSTHLRLPSSAVHSLASAPISVRRPISLAMANISPTPIMSLSLPVIQTKTPPPMLAVVNDGNDDSTTAAPQRSDVSIMASTTMSNVTTAKQKPPRVSISSAPQTMASISCAEAVAELDPLFLAAPPDGSGSATPPPAANAIASTLALPAPLSTAAIVPALHTVVADSGRPSYAHAIPARHDTCRYYLYTVLPEKGKLIWVVFFSSRRHALDQYELLLYRIASPILASSTPLPPTATPSPAERSICGSDSDGPPLSFPPSSSALSAAMTIEVEPNAGGLTLPSSAFASRPPQPSSPPQPKPPNLSEPDQQIIKLSAVSGLSWIAEGADEWTGQPLYQHKVCFQAPNSTFKRRIFCAALHQRAERTITVLGGLSLVSTTTQRDHMWSRINQWFAGEAHQWLVHNCRYHPPSNRHFVNGKGTRQGSKQSPENRFLFTELDKSVEIESVSVSSFSQT